MGIVKWNGAATKAFELEPTGSVGDEQWDSAADRMSARAGAAAKAFAKVEHLCREQTGAQRRK
jgi:hypothetical protein